MAIRPRITRGSLVCVSCGPDSGTIGFVMSRADKYVMVHTEKGLQVFSILQLEMIDDQH